MKNLFFLLFSSFSLTLIGQTTLTDSFKFDFKKAVKNSRHWELHLSNYFVQANKKQDKIQLRFKITSVSNKKEDFDPNKFFLISEKYKIRVRPVDMKHSYFFAFKGFDKLVDHQPTTKEVRVNWYKYKPTIEDTFLKYTMEGYKDIDNCLTFEMGKKDLDKSIYFDHKRVRSNVVDVYFIVPKGFKKGKIYYGNQMVADFTVKNAK